ncbi:MAG: DUF1016 N-terminal domain-containing protein [Tannerella sp.]|nr:DUF1016 N-terminal domain-containing protein [Tannerella sp.]
MADAVQIVTYMRQFYLNFPIRDTLRHELSWSHYRLIMRIENDRARNFYMDECVKSNWSTRQLERQINTHFYEINPLTALNHEYLPYC